MQRLYGVMLVVVEGEKKALAGDQAGIPCVSIPGVWAFGKKDTSGKLQLIDDLKAIDWRGRKVVVCFDSDCVENDAVQAAAFHFRKLIEDAADQRATDERASQKKADKPEAASASVDPKTTDANPSEAKPSSGPLPEPDPFDGSDLKQAAENSPPKKGAVKGSNKPPKPAKPEVSKPSHAPTVLQVILPCGPAGDKLGLDDYLKVAGRAGWDELMLTAGPPAVPDRPNELTNVLTFSLEDADETPRRPDHIMRRMLKLTKGWPKRVGTRLFVEGADHRPVWYGKEHDLFAGLQRMLGACSGAASSRVRWGDRKPGLVSKKEFHSYCRHHGPAVDGVELFPHHAPVPGLNLHYMHPPLPKRNGSALKTLIDQFSPATPSDRSLIGAYLLTQVWGGPAGSRPCFLFTAGDDSDAGGRGVGKSTVAKVVGRLFEEKVVGLTDKDDFNRIKTRILSPGADGSRILLLDNLKSLRFSWDDMEGLVTSATISGHLLFHGDARRLNLFNLAMTMNGASLSKDFAQRVIPIHLSRAKYSVGWERAVNALVDERRWEIIGDLIDVFDRPAKTLTKVGRWATWEGDVLARLKDPADLQKLIEERQSTYDADADEADIIREAIEEAINTNEGNYVTDRVKFFAPQIADILSQGLRKRMSVLEATCKPKTLRVPGLEHKRTGKYRYYQWTGEEWATTGQEKWFKPVPIYST